jgi:hypothetical protein
MLPALTTMSPNSHVQLPYDLILPILELLDKISNLSTSNLFSASLVSRVWADCARSLLFQHLTRPLAPYARVARRTSSIYRLNQVRVVYLMLHPLIAIHVQLVIVEVRSLAGFLYPLLSFLLYVFPSITTIKFHRHVFRTITNHIISSMMLG